MGNGKTSGGRAGWGQRLGHLDSVVGHVDRQRGAIADFTTARDSVLHCRSREIRLFLVSCRTVPVAAACRCGGRCEAIRHEGER